MQESEFGEGSDQDDVGEELEEDLHHQTEKDQVGVRKHQLLGCF